MLLARRIVEHQLAIERVQFALGRQRERVDLEQLRRVGTIRVVECDEHRGNRIDVLGSDVGCGHERARGLRSKGSADVDHGVLHRFGPDVFDVHASGR